MMPPHCCTLDKVEGAGGMLEKGQRWHEKEEMEWMILPVKNV